MKAKILTACVAALFIQDELVSLIALTVIGVIAVAALFKAAAEGGALD